MTTFFVYGTLKRGECREEVFSRHLDEDEFEIVPASVKAELYDLGPYPAIVPGEDTVFGEAVIVNNPDKVDTLIAVLDSIEGYYGDDSPSNLYLRKEVTIQVEEDTMEAITYMFSQEQQLRDRAKHLPDGIWGSERCIQKKEDMEGGE